ncbi:unnamed protein product, partial [Oppiella nova]
GVLCGLFAGEFFGVWVLIGSLINPKQQPFMETSIEDCPAHMLVNFTRTTSSTIESEGILSLYHIAYLLVPVFGFAISLSIGAIMSLLSGH